jgi:hypothetical protein
MNTDLKKVLVIDPIVDVEESYMASEAVFKSGINKSIFNYTADSFGDQNIIFNNITPPSLTTVTKRDLRIKYSFAVGVLYTTATGAPNFNAVNANGARVGYNPANPASATVASSTSFGVVPRACPLQASASAIELRLNGSATSTSINDYACVYPHIIDDATLKSYGSEMPLQKDNSALYADPTAYYPASVLTTLTGALPAGITGATSSIFPGYADHRSPFVPYGSNTNIPSRGSFVWTQVIAPTPVGASAPTLSYAVYRMTVVENLFISPMMWLGMQDRCAGLALVNNLILNIRFQDVNRMVSAYLPAGCSLTVSIGPNMTLPSTAPFGVSTGNITPTLLIEYITQDPILSAHLPQTIAFDYSLIQPFITSGQLTSTTGATASRQITIQSLRLASIPSKLYIFARPSKSFLNTEFLAQTTPDTFLSITNISLSFNNRINLFATFSPQDLWAMSVKNGLQDSFADWQYQGGSVLIIDISKDIMLDSDESEGQANKYSTLQAQITYSASPLAYCGATVATNYDSYVLVEQPGKAFINASECQYLLTGPSAAEVLSLTSNLDNKVDHTDLEGKGVGGGVFSSVGKLFKSGLQKFKTLNPEHVSKGLEMAQGALKSLGLGVAGGGVSGGAMRGKHSRVY